MMFVKICGITTEADALLAVGMGASAVGFVFAPSPRQMAPSAVADIVKRLPHETVTVGVFRDEAPTPGHRDRQPDRAAGRAAPRGRVGRGHPVGGRPGGPTIKAFPAGHRNIERFAEYGAQLLMIDGASPGSGELFDWRLAEGVVDPRRLIVSGGLRPENVGAPSPISTPGASTCPAGSRPRPG